MFHKKGKIINNRNMKKGKGIWRKIIFKKNSNTKKYEEIGILNAKKN